MAARRRALKELKEKTQLSVLSCYFGRLFALVRNFLVMVSVMFACCGCNASSVHACHGWAGLVPFGHIECGHLSVVSESHGRRRDAVI